MWLQNKWLKLLMTFLFGNPVGKTGVVETDFGFHVMKVEGKYDAVLLATVAFKKSTF